MNNPQTKSDIFIMYFIREDNSDCGDVSSRRNTKEADLLGQPLPYRLGMSTNFSLSPRRCSEK